MNPLLVEAAGNEVFGLEIILMLQRRVGNINVTQEAMEKAVRKGSMRTIKFFLDYTSAPITEAVVVGALMSNTPSNKLERVQLVLDRATDLPVTRRMVHTAARYSDTNCLALIWKRACRAKMGEDVTRDLAQAAIENIWPEKILRFLLDEVEDIVIGPEALVSIVKGYDTMPLLKLLIDRGINLHVTHEVLQAATGNFRKDSSLMTFLLERSDMIMLNDEIFRGAAGAGREGTLQVLSKYCGLAEVPKKWLDLVRLHDAVDSYPRAIIDSAVMAPRDTDLNLGVVTELIGRGVEPDVPDGKGLTPLFHAVLLSDILTVQALLSAGANPNSKDRQGRTPLFYAACGGHYGIVENLLDSGVQTHLEDEKGDTPVLMAKRNGHMRVFRLLERRRRP